MQTMNDFLKVRNSWDRPEVMMRGLPNGPHLPPLPPNQLKNGVFPPSGTDNEDPAQPLSAYDHGYALGKAVRLASIFF